MSVEGFLWLLVLGFLAFAGFVIFLLFKNLEFIIMATNLYKKMINRQDVMIKLLKDIRGPGKFEEDVAVVENPQIDAAPKTISQTTSTPGGSGHHWGKNPDTHDVVKTCPACNGIFHGAEFDACGDCDCALVEA